MIQIVDYEDNLNSELRKVLQVGGLNELDFDYKLNPILGVPSSSKSTLLISYFVPSFKQWRWRMVSIK